MNLFKSFNPKVIHTIIVLLIISIIIIFMGLLMAGFNFQTILDKSGTWYFPIAWHSD